MLSQCWTAPRQFAQVTACAILLIDPGASFIQTADLAGPAEAVKQSPPPTSGPGLSLLLYEGSLASVKAFSELDDATLARGLVNPAELPAGGRLTTISGAIAQEAVKASYSGLYALARKGYIGDVLDAPGEGGASLTRGPGSAPRPDQAVAFDLARLEAAAEILARPGYVGVLFLPIAFAGLTDQASIKAYDQRFRALPEARRNQVAAAVYGLPEAPSARAMQWLSAALTPSFSYIDLRITRADFPAAAIREGAFSGVTLSLPDGDAAQRRGLVNRWLIDRMAWRERQMWVGLSNLQTADEVEAAGALQIPFLSGPAIGASPDTPFGGRSRPFAELLRA